MGCPEVHSITMEFMKAYELKQNRKKEKELWEKIEMNKRKNT